MRDRLLLSTKAMRLSVCLTIVVTAATAATAQPLAVGSNTFRNNGFLPLTAVYDANGCSGANQSPELRWSHAPRGTKSFALVMHDPDAKVPGGWYHWVLFNISPRVHELAAGANISAGVAGITSFRQRKYGGPCPPPGSGVHHYIFTLYALNASRFLNGFPDGPTLQRSIRARVIGTARITGLYRR